MFKGNISEQKWKVVCKNWVLFRKMSALFKLRATSEHGPGLKGALDDPGWSPRAPRSPRAQTLYPSRKILFWKYWFFLIESWVDKLLSCESSMSLCERKMHVVTHCPHEQHKAGSRMELEFAFQLLDLKQKSNTSSQSVKGKALLHEESVRRILFSFLLLFVESLGWIPT